MGAWTGEMKLWEGGGGVNLHCDTVILKKVCSSNIFHYGTEVMVY